MTDTTERPLRFCDVCGGLDDHSRHVISGVQGGIGKPDDATLKGFDFAGATPYAVELLLNPTVRVRHVDCCAAEGCPSCIEQEKLTEGKRGDELLGTITAGALAEFEPPDLPPAMMGRPDESGVIVDG
jgi:hypothetical protein